MIIHKCNSKLPQFNYWCLYNGYYLTKDPIYDFINLAWKVIHKQILCIHKRKLKLFCNHHNSWCYNWSNFWRVRLGIPYKI